MLPQIQFPDKLQCLFRPKRFKVLYGGRGAGRSWGCARALLLLGKQRPLRVLCAREFQNSIEESVHKLLSDQIEALGLSDFYDILQKKITGKNGTTFSFEGIKNNTQRIKSYEGIDICWVEEAVKVSKSSWGVLIPTIRETGSEIWLTFNPELKTDYTYDRFVLDTDLAEAAAGIKESPRSVVVHMNFLDNPWFEQSALQDEMLECKRKDPDAYDNIWLGHCVETLEGVVYAKELRAAKADGRICRVPYDREFPVSTAWDLGRADNTAIWFWQRIALQTRIVGYYEASGEDITHFLKELQRRPYMYAEHCLPHDASAKRLGSQKTIEEKVRAQYPGLVRVLPKLSVTDGINAGRLAFSSCWFDEKACEDGLNALRHYRYKVKEGHLSNEPLHDWASDGADAFRYLALAIRSPRGKKTVAERLGDQASKLKSALSSGPSVGWMR